MKIKYKSTAVAFSVLFVALALLRSNPGVSAAATGQIVGTIRLDGEAPHQKPIDMSKDPYCALTRTGPPATAESVVVGANGGLANVVVYLSQGLSGTEPPASQTVKLEQKGCQYIPHVVVVNPGQHLAVINDDKTSHNIHPDPKPGGGNHAWNRSQLEGGPPIDVTWSNEELAIPVKCNVHPWMRAYIVVVKGPSGVSDGSGSFKLEGVAPGAYTLTAWHEIYGIQSQKVTVQPGKSVTMDFRFKAASGL